MGQSDEAARLVAEGYRAQQAGRIDHALHCYDEALRRQPESFEAAFLSGLIYLQSGRIGQARNLLGKAAVARPHEPDVLLNYGTAIALSGGLPDALAVFDRVLERNPQHPGALLNRANVLVRLDRLNEALAALNKARAADPTNPQIPNNRGNALSLLGRFEEALQGYADALKLAPNYAEALVNRGNTLLLLKRDADAIASYEAALRLRPDHADAHYGLSFALLRGGDLKRGFAEYEWRWRRLELANYRRDLGRPIWLGNAPIEGKTLFIHAEQGFGDTLHFARYLRDVANKGARIALEVQPQLKPLFADWPVAALIGRGEALPEFDLHCPLLSLPLALGVTHASGAEPYIRAPAAQFAAWRERLPQDRRLKVGVAWSGNRTFRNDRHRSMTLAAFAPILATPGVTFATLNPDVAPAERDMLSSLPQVLPLASEFRDFADTAGVIANLDLVISTDTSVPHLAGALGKEVWVLLGFAPDWRWFLDRADCPWYPSARFYRQPAIGDWASVVEKIRGALAARATAI